MSEEKQTPVWQEVCQSKWIHPAQLVQKVQQLRIQQQTIATINGSFDLLHAGHLYMLYEAAKQADRLIVALNSDHSVQQYKSMCRPIIPLEYRLQLMAALSFVDYVTWFDETDPRKVLAIIAPDVHVNGEEYGQNCIESTVVKATGGRLHLVPRIEGLATSAIIQKILRVEKQDS